MENELFLVVNDVTVPIVSFTETLIDRSRDNAQQAELYIRLPADAANINDLQNVGIITNMAVYRNDAMVWSSDKYTELSRLSLEINTSSEAIIDYTAIFY